MPSNDSNQKRIKSVDATFEIIEYLNANGSASLSDIADRVGRSRSTTYYYLKTLRERRYVSKDGDEYRVGLRFFNIGCNALRRVNFYGIGEEEVETLAKQGKGVVHILAVDQGKAIVVCQASGDQNGDLHFGEGTELDLHSTAYGKVILAYLPQDVRTEYISGGLPAATECTMIEVNEIEEEIENIRQFGFAFSEGEYEVGVSSIAAPIFRGKTDDVIGAVGVTKASEEFTNPTKEYKARRFMEELPRQVQHTARILSKRMSEVP